MLSARPGGLFAPVTLFGGLGWFSLGGLGPECGSDWVEVDQDGGPHGS